MTYNNIKNIILSVLFGFMTLMSCIDDDYSLSQGEDDDIPEGIREGYSINMIVTLDKMGGTRAGNVIQLEDMENYIDPEKFRVLFFDSKDTLLFESKSRWVKKLDPGSIHSEWLVSVPVFTYGNDVFEIEDEKGDTITVEWDWEYIRKKLTTENFKIAILANRPELDYYPKLSGIEIGAHWYDNRGPLWTPEHTGKVDVFDLHHCQYDPMYHGKSATDLNADEASKYSDLGIGFYDFIMKDWMKVNDKDATYYNMKPKMGATSSWVNHLDRRTLPAGSPSDMMKNNSDYPYVILPSYEHPIPMYGIQRFDPITNWTKGTPFNVSNLIQGSDGDASKYKFNTIPLLRSVVRLDLLIPKTSYPKRPNLVGLWYSNVYSRCEPMDVWTPTNLIWEENHEDSCEWNDIMDYGLIVSANEKQGGTKTKNGTNRKANTKLDFQNTISWFYGAWKDKKWPFLNNEDQDLTPIDVKDISYPRIFNPCVQRNKFVISSICSTPTTQENPDPKPDPGIQGDVSDWYDDNYWHFVAYTGERNMIDVNRIPIQEAQTSYTVTWMFKDVDRDQYFFIPIADYSKSQKLAKECFGPYKSSHWNGSSNLPNPKDDDKKKEENNIQIHDYADNLRENIPAKGEKFKDENKYKGEMSRDEMPWPLLRNHIYRITVTGPAPTELTRSYTWDFTKSLNGTTVYNLKSDSKWKDPGNVETKIVSADYLPDDSNVAGTGKAVVSWKSEGGDWEGTLTRNSKNKFNSNTGDANKIKINGTSYIPIKTGRGDDDELGGITDRKTTFSVPEGKLIKKMTLYSYVWTDQQKVTYALKTGEAHTAGETVNVKNGSDEVATLTFGFTGGANFNAATANTSVSGFTAFTAGNGENGESTSGTCYIIKPKYDGNVEVGVVLNPNKNFYVLEDDIALADYNGITVSEKKYGTYKFDVKGGKTYKVYCTVSKLGFYGFNYTYPSSKWESVTSDKGDNYGPGRNMNAFKANHSTPDVEEFSINDAQSVSFTNNKSGAQVCYVASVEVEGGVYTDYWEYKNPNGELKANGKIIPELQGLKFSTTGSICIYETNEDNKSKIRLTDRTTITLPNMPNGSTITIDGECDDKTTNWITGNNNLQSNGENSWKVTTSSDSAVPVVFTCDGRSELYKIDVVVPQNSRSTRAVGNGKENGLTIESEDLHSKSLKFK